MSILSRALLLAVAALVLGCDAPAPEAEPPPRPDPGTGEVAVIRMAAGGEMRIRLFSGRAPGHVANFKKLAREGFYDGTTFHRVIPDFMIQGGDPNSKDDDPTNDGKGTPGYFIRDEVNGIPHRRGIVAMANQGRPGTGGCQFYIMVADNTQWQEVLDTRFTVFGEVVSGMDVADRIVAVPRDTRDRPLENQTMASITIQPATGATP